VCDDVDGFGDVFAWYLTSSIFSFSLWMEWDDPGALDDEQLPAPLPPGWSTESRFTFSAPNFFAYGPVDSAIATVSITLTAVNDVPVAIGALARLGFAPTHDSVRAMDQPWIASLARRQPGIRIRDSQIGRIHLWWSPAGAEGRADDMMARAVSPRSKELPARVLAPVDQLLQTCSQTLCRSDFRPLWWVVDATLMLRGHSFDGTQLTVLARQRRLTLPIAAMLTYLDDAFDAPMPTGAISHLLAAPFDQKDRSGHLARIDPRLARSWGRVFGVLSQYLQHRRVSPEGSFLEFVSVAKNRPLLPPAKPDAAAPDSTLM
jgi:hypothetical protein